jgi:hypothetical protein
MSLVGSTTIAWIWYILIVAGAVLGIIIFGLYIAFSYHMGKAMSPFLTARVKAWSDKSIAIFEILSLTGGVTLDYAKHELGGYRRASVTRTVKEPMSKTKKALVAVITIGLMINTVYLLFYYTDISFLYSIGISFIWCIVPAIAHVRQPSHQELVGHNRPQPLIVPKSVYTINGVTTVPMIDLHPVLHTDLKKGLQELIDRDIDTYQKFIDIATVSPEVPLIPGYTYKTFMELLNSYRQKYEFDVKISDVSLGVSKSFDKTYAESIAAKDFNYKTKKRKDNKYALYGYVAVILMVIGIVIKLIYVTFYGGGGTT